MCRGICSVCLPTPLQIYRYVIICVCVGDCGYDNGDVFLVIIHTFSGCTIWSNAFDQSFACFCWVHDHSSVYIWRMDAYTSKVYHLSKWVKKICFCFISRHMGWLVFLHYMDLFGYLFRSLAQNEFLSDTFSARPKGTS